jgi:hypothetical protein
MSRETQQYNDMDRSCEATIYPVLVKPLTTGILGAQGPQSTGDISDRFSVPFTIALDDK